MHPALLVIDAQQEYFRPHGKWVVEGGEAALAQIERLLEVFRSGGLPIVHVVHEALDPGSPVFRKGSEGAAMHPRLTVRQGEERIIKHFPGAFTQTPLDAYLRRFGADTLVVTGFQTQHCCDATTRQARERGFNALFASDATATRDLAVRGEVVRAAQIQRSTLASMTGFADVVSSDEICERFS